MPACYGKESLFHAEMSVSLHLNEEFSTHELLDYDFFFLHTVCLQTIEDWEIGA